MNELIKRSFFGLIYVVLVILALQSYLWASALFVLFMLLGLHEFSKLVSLPYKTALVPAIIIFFMFFLFYHPDNIENKTLQTNWAFVLLVLFIPLIFFIFDKLSKEVLGNFYLAMIYVVLPFSLALGVSLHLLLAVFVILWSSDTFAFITGKYFGKHKLAEKISPKKTIEGFVGGFIGSMLMAFLFYRYANLDVGLQLTQFLFLTSIVVVTGALGDLLESRFKRLAGVKDSGNVIPGHGGILDRLDSFMLAVPFVFIYLLLI